MESRNATTDDTEAIREIAWASWEADYPDILSRETVEEGVEEWYSPERIETEIQSDDVLLPVAEVEDELVGFAHAVEDESGGTVLRVYVAPEHRREGIGGDLLSSAHDALRERGAEQVRAMVLAENDPGNEFYRQHGFELAEESETVIGDSTHRENVYVTEE